MSGTYTRTRILLRYGRVVKRLKPDVIANTGVVGSAFAHVIPRLDSSQIVEPHEDIRKMQAALHARGLFPAAADGDFGRATRNAIRSFEQMNNMPVTGLPTVSLLNRLLEERVSPSHLNSSGGGQNAGPARAPNARDPRAPRAPAAGGREWTLPPPEFRPVPQGGREW